MVPMTLMSMTRRSVAGSVSRNGQMRPVTPALFTRAVTGPSAFSASSKRRPTVSGSATSPRMASARLPLEPSSSTRRAAAASSRR
jgi:hypothetical protein